MELNLSVVARGVVLLLLSLRVEVPALWTGAAKEGEMRVVKGKAGCAWRGRWNQSRRHSSATALRRWRFLGRAGAERRELSRGFPGPRSLQQPAAPRCWNCKSSVMQRKKNTYNQLKWQNLCPLPPPSTPPPCFPNPKSVLCFTGKLIEDCVETENFPQNKWSVLIWIHLSICEVQMIWQKV